VLEKFRIDLKDKKNLLNYFFEHSLVFKFIRFLFFVKIIF
jgi:hypothetical protein